MINYWLHNTIKYAQQKAHYVAIGKDRIKLSLNFSII